MRNYSLEEIKSHARWDDFILRLIVTLALTVAFGILYLMTFDRPQYCKISMSIPFASVPVMCLDYTRTCYHFAGGGKICAPYDFKTQI